ncbi:MAG: Na/Pi cotransporter family protein [Chromatiaceae bacterium]|nr:Na/Pi cotransporter family protein [Chromatiaceae bacterium]
MPGIDASAMLLGLIGGLALFLFGLEQMALALKALAGDRLKDLLASITRNRFLGALSGALVTALLNSSSVTTVLLVGFVSAGLMSLTQSVGVIMGANIGSTLTAQLIAFQIDEMALLLIALGFAAQAGLRGETARHAGTLLLGLGLIFFGMSVMSTAMEPLRDYPPFLDLMRRLADPLLGVLVGAAFTALVQSSAATTGIAIVLASQGLMTLPTGIALVFGANIGTCATALLATIGKSREALRAALVHVFFNVAGVLLWFAFIDDLAALVAHLSPAYPALAGAERLAAEVPRQIANAHTLFNVANTLIFIGLAGWFARLATWLVPEPPPSAEPEAVHARYLDAELLTTPALALDRARLEILHMGEYVQRMMRRILPATLAGNRAMLHDIARMDDAVDTLHAEIVVYLGQISRQPLSERQTQDLMRLMEAANSLENIGDLIETDLVVLGKERLEAGVSISNPTREVLSDFHRAVVRALIAAVQAVAQNSPEAAQSVIGMKGEIARIADSAAVHEARRLVAQEPKRVPAYTIEIDIIEKLKRIYYFSKRMAKTVTPREGL